MLDTIDEEADVASLAAELAQSDDPAELIGLSVRLTRRLNERCGDIIGALLSAASVEPDAATAAAEGKRRHRDGTARTAQKLHALGALRGGMTAHDAAALLATLTWQSTYAQLTHDHNWTYEQCERSITSILASALLRPPPTLPRAPAPRAAGRPQGRGPW